MSDKLVTIASFTNVAEAEVARIALAAAGIRARLANAALVSWFWHYSQATGGVGVLVRQSESELAWTALYQTPDDTSLPGAPAICQVCSEPFYEGWDLCWRCGADRDGHAAQADTDEAPHEPSSTDSFGNVELVGLAAMTAAILFLVSRVLSAAVIVIVAICQLDWFFQASQPEGSATLDEDQPLPPLPGRAELIAEAVSARAWRATVFGVFWFPPLIYYSIYVLYRLMKSNLPRSRRARSRCAAAWCINLVLVVPWTVMMVTLIFGILFAFADFAGEMVFFAPDPFEAHDRPW